VSRHFEIYCLRCGAVQDEEAARCDTCGGTLGFRYDYEAVEWDERFRGSMWRYRGLLPVADPDAIVTLGEGGTPLLVSRSFTGSRVYLKDETRNPTGSQKDRPLALAITHAREIGKNASIVVSSGSTGISNAALAARAGMRSIVVVAAGAPEERIYPVFALGATLLEADGQVDEVIERVEEAARDHGFYVSSTCRTSNPYQAEATKTIAYEIIEDLGRSPDWVVVPVGGGGTVAGIWRGFRDLQELGRISSPPRLLGVVASDYNALEVGYGLGTETADEPFSFIAPGHRPPPTILVKIAHVYPPDGAEALQAVRASGGSFVSVTDEDALDAQFELGRREGLYVEPSSAAVLTAIQRTVERGDVGGDETVVVILSGAGFRETFVSLERRPLEKQPVALDELPETLAEALGSPAR
jgi:threonine synthase